MNSRELAAKYGKAHDMMRNIDGLQPQEAFDELLKYIYVREISSEIGRQLPDYKEAIFDQSKTNVNQKLISELRSLFQDHCNKPNSIASYLWNDCSFHLSDSALLAIHQTFQSIDFKNIDLDIRSTALNEFIPNNLRRGLGIFSTPEHVARAVVEHLSPTSHDIIADPACGTGTFLIECIKNIKNKSVDQTPTVFGIDKSPRMLILAELNLGNVPGIQFEKYLMDALYPDQSNKGNQTISLENRFDYILTNPPFGVKLYHDKQDLTNFETCYNRQGKILKKQNSEIVFLEICIKYLKPGGKLGIVLPKSILTNTSFVYARETINKYCFLTALVILPPETFYLSGTQTNTVILFLQKYVNEEDKKGSISIISANISNVGHDATGRKITGNELPSLAKNMANAASKNDKFKNISLMKNIDKDKSLSQAMPLVYAGKGSNITAQTISLSNLVEVVKTGKTPRRKDYSSDGLFLVKVGNLTGQGINWKDRDRNYISQKHGEKICKDDSLMLKQGDILFTSSAHTPVYICKKVDIVTTIPDWVGSQASYVGELMLVRVKRGIDPFIMLAFLRLPSTAELIKSIIRGQTAHVSAHDFMALQIPNVFKNTPDQLVELANLLRKEANLYVKLNEIGKDEDSLQIDAEEAVWG